MCRRFTNGMTWGEIRALYSIHDYGPPPSNMPPRYNIAPTQSVNSARLDEAGKMELDYGRWWLVPFFAKQLPKAAWYFESTISDTDCRKGPVLTRSNAHPSSKPIFSISIRLKRQNFEEKNVEGLYVSGSA